MAYELENIVREWMDHLKGLNVEVKKMFGCYCLYCDGQAVGWIHNSVMSLREVGLDYLPKDIKRPTKEDKIQELVIPLDYAMLIGFRKRFKIRLLYEKEWMTFGLINWKLSLCLTDKPPKNEYPPSTGGTTEQEIRNGFLLFFCPK